jgi:hypothetical protein
MKVKFKPVVVEAEQYFSGKAVEGVCDGCLQGFVETGGAHIHTPAGMIRVQEKDWVITGIKGERYLCKPDIFEAIYEPAGAAEGVPGETE